MTPAYMYLQKPQRLCTRAAVVYRGLMPDVVPKLPPYEVKNFFAHFSLLWDRCVLKIIIRVHRIRFRGRFWLIIAISGFLMGFA